MLIYLDESGDLGFDFNKPKTSEKFVITLLACDNTVTMRHFRKAVRRTLKNKLNHKNARSRIVQELKGTRTSLTIKEYFYRNLPESGWHIYSVILNKKRVYNNLRSKKGKKKPLGRDRAAPQSLKGVFLQRSARVIAGAEKADELLSGLGVKS